MVFSTRAEILTRRTELLANFNFYAAGFFDGEGCISIGNNGSISCGIVNTNIEILEMFKEIYGGSVSPRKQKVNKEQFVWRVYGETAISFLETIIDILVEKQSQAIVVLAFYQNRQLVKGIRITGKRGKLSHPDRPKLIKIAQEELTYLKNGGKLGHQFFNEG